MYRYEAIALARQMMKQAGVTDELPPWVVDAVLRAANTHNDTLEGVIDLNKESFDAICNAAAESKWIPPEYMRNDWVYDVCEFLRSGDESPAERTPVLYRRLSPTTGVWIYADGGPNEPDPVDGSVWQPLYAD